ncbi:hypothetical protein IW262DRAFT_1256507, partial [Armillaria fumosa]
MQTYLADSRLPMSFWGNVLKTASYIRCCIPTLTLPDGKTPFETMHSDIPNLSHLHWWECQCFIAIPPELHTKSGPHRFEAIFIGYEEGHKRWCVRDLAGKYHFSCDIKFNENIPSCL